MSSDTQHLKIIFTCDTCDETFTGAQQETFQAVWSRAREDGWRTRKIGTEWVHGCPDCGID